MTILLSESIDSNAAVSAGTAKSVTVTYNNSENNICYGNTYLPWNWLLESEWLNGTDYDYEKARFWYKGKQSLLFTSEAQYYGYSVKVSRTTKTTLEFNNADANFWCIGTAGQLMNGENRGGIVSSTSFTAWVPTNNSIQAVHMAPFFAFSYLQMPDGEWINGDYAINCKYTVTYTGYKTQAEYASAMSSIQSELQHQTTELESQTQELENQTAELEEQTETQKGIFSSIQKFFGSFFDNLIDSVIGLFVPSTEEMKSLFDRLLDFFNERFGFLFYPFDFFVRVVDLFLDSSGGSTIITFPAFSIMGYQVWSDVSFDLTEYDIVVELFGYVRMLTGVFISVGFINYLKRKYEMVIRR